MKKKANLIDKILCLFKWHVQSDNVYHDGINRLHSNCKFCYTHLPMFSVEIKFVFGKWRCRRFITNLSGNRKIPY